VPRPGHKKVPPPDQSNGAPFCAPVGAGLIPSVNHFSRAFGENEIPGLT
jgi:hypothetical protein